MNNANINFGVGSMMNNLSNQSNNMGGGMGNMGGGGNITYPLRTQQQGFGHGQPQTQMQSNTGNQGQGQNNRVFTGTVTKLHENFGFIDDDVFFSTNVVKGNAPKVGDRVLAESVYNASMPFKWNATRVTPIPTPGAMSNLNNPRAGGNMNNGGAQRGFGDQRRSGDLRSEMNNMRDNRPRDRMRQNDSNKSDRRSFEPAKAVSATRERSTRKRSRTRSKSKSPPRRVRKHAPRYNCSVPKVCLNFPGSNVMDLNKRYKNIYIPSDFFQADHVWNEAFPLEAPFKITMPSSFTVMSKEHVVPIEANRFKVDPADADYSYVAKVMLIASPGLQELYDKTCYFIEKDTDDVDARDGLVHPSRALKFLVGVKGRTETMAVGGPWSPSLDGADPANDPSVLIKTAIRTCGAMTGVDLSGCTQWTRFLEFHYRRQPTATKPARTEVVVLFLPDVWSAMPNKVDYDDACAKYASNLALRLEGKTVVAPEIEEEEMEAVEEGDLSVMEPKGDPTNWQDLDPKTMKVNDLKSELEARGQSSKGLKSQLQARLQKALQTEEEEEKAKVEADDEAKEEIEEKEEAKEEELDDRKKEKIKSAYKTPSNPTLFVHPNTKIKSGKFDCKVESLSVLLDYRHDDNKEGTFEVSMFAELFNEMLMRDNAFNIYKEIVSSKAPEPVEKKKDEKEKTKDGEKDKKDDEKEKDSEKEKEKAPEEKKKMVTNNKEMLLACSYFDLSHCGYFEAKDLEDIFLALELALSRAEVKKVAMKFASGHRDHINYRSLVDIEEGAELPVKESTDAVQTKELTSGFRKYLPAAASSGDGAVQSGETPQTNKLVKFRGTVLDLEQLMDKLDKAEVLRNATDNQLSKVQKELKEVKSAKDKLTEVKTKLTKQFEDSQQKVIDQELALMQSRGEVKKNLAAMKDVYLRIKPFVEPPKETSEKESQKDEPKVEVKPAVKEEAKKEEAADAKKEEEAMEEGKEEKPAAE